MFRLYVFKILVYTHVYTINCTTSNCYLNVITFTLFSFKIVPLPYTLHTRITQIYIRVHILHAEGLHFGAFDPLAEDDDKDTEEQKDGSGESVKWF